MDDKSISKKLKMLRRSLMRRRAAFILTLCLGSFAAAVILGALAGLFLPFTELQCFVFVLSAGLLASLAALSLALRILLSRTPLPVLAERIEAAHPEFMDSLICAVEKEELSRPLGILEEALVEKVRGETSDFNFMGALLPERLRGPSILAAAVFAAVLLFAAARTDVSRKADNYARERLGLITPGLDVRPGDFEAARNGDVEITAEVRRWENDADIEIKDSYGIHRYRMNRSRDISKFTLYGLSEPLEYRVLTPSLSSEIFRVSVYDPPSVEKFDCEVIPPEYTGAKAKAYGKMQDFPALAGSTVRFRVLPSPADSKVFLDRDGNAESFSAQGAARTPACSFRIAANTECRIRVEDAKGHQFLSETFKIECIPDFPPAIDVLSPERDAVSKADAAMVFKAVTSDDYGLAKIKLAYSVSGGPEKTAVLSDGMKGPDGRLLKKMETQCVVDFRKLGAANGDIVCAYFAAEDNCEPESHVTRSEIVFVELREETTPSESKGSGQKEKLEIFRLIAEIKRLIRLSYDILSSPSSEGRALRDELARGMGDLRVEASAMLDKVAGVLAAGGADGGPFLKLFEDGVERLKSAEKLIGGDAVMDSIPFQQKALADFTVIAQELMKNQQSGSGSGDSEQEQSGKKDQEKGRGRGDLRELVEEMKKMLSDVNRLAERQNAVNGAFRSMPPRAPESEAAELARRQDEIRKSAESLVKSIPEEWEASRLEYEMKSAGDSMERAGRSIKESDSRNAAASGGKAHYSLNSAADVLRQMIRGAAAAQIEALAGQADRLSKDEASQAQASKEAASSPEGRQKAKGMKAAQDGLGSDLSQLMDAAGAVSEGLDAVYPEASKSLRASLESAARSGMQGDMKKASNALLYAKFAKASELQDSAAAALASFAASLKEAKKKIPRLSQEEIISALRKIEEAKAAMKGEGGKGAKPDAVSRTRKRIGADISGVGEELDDLRLSEMGMALMENQFEKEPEKGAAQILKILGEAEYVLSSYLAKSEAVRRIELRMKTSTPPEKYRPLVEDYFKSLSE